MERIYVKRKINGLLTTFAPTAVILIVILYYAHASIAGVLGACIGFSIICYIAYDHVIKVIAMDDKGIILEKGFTKEIIDINDIKAIELTRRFLVVHKRNNNKRKISIVDFPRNNIEKMLGEFPNLII